VFHFIVCYVNKLLYYYWGQGEGNKVKSNQVPKPVPTAISLHSRKSRYAALHQDGTEKIQWPTKKGAIKPNYFNFTLMCFAVRTKTVIYLCSQVAL